jgi:hypothetical protein
VTAIPSLDEVSRNPEYLLHDVNPAARTLKFRPTNAEALRRAAFVDGRTDIWTGNDVSFAIGAFEARAPTLDRCIFHMSFCGSTLLARLLDRPGKSLVLREPDILVKLADWKTALQEAATDSSDFRLALNIAQAMLGRRLAQDEPVTVKASSWANNLIPELSGEPTRSLFITIQRERFLQAVLRGGRERLAYSARLAAHLAPFFADGARSVQAAIGASDDPLGKAMRLAAVAHELQRRLFERACRNSKASELMRSDEIQSDLAGSANRAAKTLQLELNDEDIAANCARWTNEHSKNAAAFSLDEQRRADWEIRGVHGALIAGTVGWALQVLGPGDLPDRPNR